MFSLLSRLRLSNKFGSWPKWVACQHIKPIPSILNDRKYQGGFPYKYGGVYGLYSAVQMSSKSNISSNSGLPVKKQYIAGQTRLIRNCIQCLVCNELLESKEVHQLVSCKCSNGAFVDGGLDYSRVGAADLNKVKYLQEYEKK